MVSAPYAPACGGAIRQVLGSGGTRISRAAAKGPAEAFCHRHTARIAPVAVDRESVEFSLGDGRPHGLIGSQAALDAPRIERHGQTAARRVPQLFAGQKNAFKNLALAVQNVQMRSRFAPAHRRREIHVESKYVAGQNGRGRVDALDSRFGKVAAGGPSKIFSTGAPPAEDRKMAR